MKSNESLFSRLRASSGQVWNDYLEHPFVKGIGDGSLPESSFRHYLTQDFIFLFHFSRAYALAAYKANNVEQIRRANKAITNIIDVEMGLHIQYCKEWNIDLTDVTTMYEDLATTAYTRFVFDCGHRGDLLDLSTALIPCIAGYAEIGANLIANSATNRKGNPYFSWIEMYADDEYQLVAKEAIKQLDDLSDSAGGSIRFTNLLEIFKQATVLEKEFWEMGWQQRCS